MKYLTFDWEQLIRDYNTNKHAVESLKGQIKVLEKERVNPFVEHKGDIEMTLAVCRYKLLEYETYISMVKRGFDVLEEDERKILVAHYIRGKKPKEIAADMFSTESTIRRRLKEGQTTFKNVVFPE